MLLPLEVLNLYTPHDDTLTGLLKSRLESRADEIFIRFGEEQVSWKQFYRQTLALASLLRSRGIGRGDRVAIVARNSPLHVVTLFAAARLGVAMVPVNPELGLEELRYALTFADVRGIFADAERVEIVRSAIDGGGRAWLMSVEDLDLERIDEVQAAALEKISSAGQADDTAVIIYTSGTTGFPKGVMHGQRNVVAAGEAFVQRVRLQPSDRLMVILPFYHMNALFYSVAGAVAAGASLVIVPRFSASSFWGTAARSGATIVNMIEAVGSIMQARSREEFDPAHRIRAAYGIRERSAKVFREEFGITQLFSGFGMTEVPGVTCNPFDAPNKPGSMGILGRHPDPNRKWAECRILGENGKDLPDDETGELAIKSPIVMQGYFRDPKQTAAAFRDGWFLTGDLVKRDADGFYFFVSRKKDIIRRRGENIAAAELERVVNEHPAVSSAAAIAVPSELGEDDIFMVVVPKDGNDLPESEIARWCHDRLAPHKVPRFVALAKELPYTPTHKIAKEVLRRDSGLRARAVEVAPPAAATQGG